MAKFRIAPTRTRPSALFCGKRAGISIVSALYNSVAPLYKSPYRDLAVLIVAIHHILGKPRDLRLIERIGAVLPDFCDMSIAFNAEGGQHPDQRKHLLRVDRDLLHPLDLLPLGNDDSAGIDDP